ncbi:ribonuclease T2 family protein [Propylenella binzhouense]|uniref:ribonuclease T2 family protein n=1 Tax=Propylenella binzhouense TaxID=2555902 RepID=UPI0013704A6C|nr:ribonuclease T2 [Propylenella binzhouense]
MRRAALPLLAAILLAISGGPLSAGGRAGAFDFYVLALSWHPTFCASAREDRNPGCDDGERGFAVHGLWPQYENGYPEFCDSDEPVRVPPGLARSVADLIPDPDAAAWQWRKHGRCSGLDRDGYFAALRAAWNRIRIPPALARPAPALRLSARAIEQMFVAENAGMSERGIAVACASGRLSEVRICMTRDLAFRRCPEVDEKGCSSRRLQVPAAR